MSCCYSRLGLAAMGVACSVGMVSGAANSTGTAGSPTPLEITIDVERKALDLDVPADEIARRFEGWAPPPPRYTGGVMAKYAALVGSASEGAVTTGPRMTANLAR